MGSNDNENNAQKENNREFTFAFNNWFICRNSEEEKNISLKI